MRGGLSTRYLRTGPLHPRAQAQAASYYRRQAQFAGGTALPVDDLLAYAHAQGLEDARLDDYARVRLGSWILRTVEQVDAAVAERG